MLIEHALGIPSRPACITKPAGLAFVAFVPAVIAVLCVQQASKSSSKQMQCSTDDQRDLNRSTGFERSIVKNPFFGVIDRYIRAGHRIAAD